MFPRDFFLARKNEKNVSSRKISREKYSKSGEGIFSKISTNPPNFEPQHQDRLSEEQAYEDLDDATKARLAPLTTVNRTIGLKEIEEDARRTGDWTYHEWFKQHFAFPEPRFPAVTTHPVTGRKCIYVNKVYTKAIEGPGLEDLGGSKALIRRLADLVKVPEYQCRMRWRAVGDMLMWDNRSVQHYAVGDYGDETLGGGPRWMDHCATLGTTPI